MSVQRRRFGGHMALEVDVNVCDYQQMKTARSLQAG